MTTMNRHLESPQSGVQGAPPLGLPGGPSESPRRAAGGFSIALLGDVALAGLFREEPGGNVGRFAGVAPLLGEADLVFANLETPVVEDIAGLNLAKKEQFGVLLHTDKAVAETVLPLLNISVVSLANNHIFDGGFDGVKQTVRCLEHLGIRFTGAGTCPGHVEPVIIEKNGRRLGFMAYVHESSHPLGDGDREAAGSGGSGFYINLFDEDKILAEVKELKKRCDTVILSLHWGIDYSHYPGEEQQRVSKRFIEAGVDIIMGHHPHTVQPFEKHSEGFIFYSLGSFCFGDFIYEGKLRALKRKTKKTILPFFALEPRLRLERRISLKELQGNRVTVRRRSLYPWLVRKRFFMKLKHRYRPVHLLITLKETFFDRLVEYFFGYYRNPITQLFSLGNIRKLKYSFRDYSGRRQ